MKKIILFFTFTVISSTLVYAQKSTTDRATPSTNVAASGAIQIENDGIKKYGTGLMKFYTPTASNPVFEKFSFSDNGIFNIWDLNTNEGFGLGVNSSGQLEFLSNGVDALSTTNTRMVIDDNTGNVGIGVLAPLAKLDIIGGNWDAGNGNGDLKIGDATYQFKVGVATAGGGAGDIRMFAKGGTGRMIWGSGTTDLMSLTNVGRLGLRTIEPEVGLHLMGINSIEAQALIQGPGAGIPSLAFRRSGGTLDAQSALIAESNLGQLNFYAHTGTDFQMGAYIRALTKENWSTTARGTYIAFGTTAVGTTTLSEKMRIDNSGNVGIGTTTPDNKLDVKGIIRAEEVVVETGWADYVFDESYQLNDLSSVENYIKENKHLPNVPSAKEIQENGAHVADLMTKMMAKIEELTLYSIKQQKEIDELKKKLENK